jgi:hypothetical protein
MHSLIAHFQDLSKDDTLVMVCVLDLTKTHTTQEFLWTVLPDTKTKIKIKMLLISLSN